MQGPIENALMTVMAGNAYLAGKSIGAFWPDAPTFRFIKSCEFRTDSGSDDFPLLAADPLAWFASLKPWCRGLRLHANEPTLQPGQLPGVKPRMLVGFVGGGPRWLVEAVGADKSEVWEGFDKLGDRKDPEQKIWTKTWIRQDVVKPGQAHPVALKDALPALRSVLPEIEAYAREEKRDNFADCFARALTALEPAPKGEFHQAFARYAHADDSQMRVLAAVMEAWVFGGMGSWNDTGGGERYDALSERLFDGLCGVICGLGNSSFRG